MQERRKNNGIKKITVYDCGLVVNPSHPYLGASPDGIVFDPSSTSPFGILEIKIIPAAHVNHPLHQLKQDS